jgi:uncharacterized protein YjbJ (UPF0337 family)
MATTDKARNSTEPTKGTVKKAPGKATGDHELSVEGKSKMKENLKKAGFTR